MPKANQHASPNWSTLVVEKDGTARLDRTGLTIDQARKRIKSHTYPGCPESFILQSPHEDARNDQGTFGVVYIIGHMAHVHAIGLSEERAKQLAVEVIRECGPDAPPKPDIIIENPDGTRTRYVDGTPIVRQAHAIDMAEVMQMVEFA